MAAVAIVVAIAAPDRARGSDSQAASAVHGSVEKVVDGGEGSRDEGGGGAAQTLAAEPEG